MRLPRFTMQFGLVALLLVACVAPSETELDAAGEVETDGDDSVGVIFGPIIAPDLVEATVVNPPSDRGIGDTFTATDTVTNQGTADAGPTGTKYYLSLNGITPVYLLGDRAVPALAAGASHSGTAALTVPLGVTEGSYFLVACADSGFGSAGRASAIDELDENNNCMGSAGTVTIGGADVVVTAVAVSPSVLDSSTGTLTVTDTVRNIGSGGAGNSVTRWYLSTDNTRSLNDAYIRNCFNVGPVPGRNVGPLAAGTSSSGTGSVTPICIRDANGLHPPAPGTYFVIACADETRTVGEVNEDNNCTGSSNSVTIVQGSDIAQIAVSNPPATGQVAATFQVIDTAQNIGVTTLPSTFTKFYFSSDGTAADLDFHLATRSIPSLAPNQTNSATTTVTIPQDVEGTFFLVACADSGPGTSGRVSQVTESNEANNCRASTTTITVRSADLVIPALSNPPVAAVPGAAFTINGTTRNIGTTATGNFHNKYYLAGAPASGFIVALLLPGGIPVAGLAAGASSPFSVMVTVPSGTPAGMYYVLACADAGPGVGARTSQIPETREDNNCNASATRITVL